MKSISYGSFATTSFTSSTACAIDPSRWFWLFEAFLALLIGTKKCSLESSLLVDELLPLGEPVAVLGVSEDGSMA